jgi:hypothetical protein
MAVNPAINPKPSDAEDAPPAMVRTIAENKLMDLIRLPKYSET